jgi:hypothetical protein
MAVSLGILSVLRRLARVVAGGVTSRFRAGLSREERESWMRTWYPRVRDSKASGQFERWELASFSVLAGNRVIE